MRYPALTWQKVKDLSYVKRPSPLVILGATGGLSLLAYILFSVLPLFIPGADFSHFPPYLALPEGGFDLSHYYLLYLVICVNALLLFSFYILALKAVANLPSRLADTEAHRRFHFWPADHVTSYIFGGAALFHLVMLATPFLLSTDLFDYIRHGRIFAFYGENPLVVPATYFPQDPFFTMGGWVGTGSVYGPLHVYITAALARIAGDGIATNFVVFKAFFVGLNLVNVALIGMITARLRPGLEKKAMLFYGWNPFILTLVAANGHNDILMLTFVLAGVLCYIEQRLFSGALFITLATLVKFIALPILFVYISLVARKQPTWNRRLLAGATSLMLAAASGIISYAPLWEGRETFSYLTAVGQKTNFTIPSLLRDVAAGHLQLSLSNTIVQLTLATLLAAYLIWHIIGVKNTAALLSAAAGLALLTPLALFWFQPWYLTLALGLIALRPWRLMYKAALVFSFSVTFFDSFWWHAPMSMDIQKPLRVLVVFGIPVALLSWLKGKEVLPGLWKRTIAWTLEESNSGKPHKVTDPPLTRVVIELAAIIAAAAVPMALVISSSPQLRAMINLIELKLKLLIGNL